MLVRLSVRRVALIESLELEFGSGFCVLTGETGAGKSVLLDAIGLLLGNRASADMIRAGCDDAVVEALFEIPNPVLQTWVQERLDAWGMAWDAAGLLISRTITRSGRTVCRINGHLATVQMLRELGARLVQQHGQHDQQGLLHADEQLRLLDLYAKHVELSQEMALAYEVWSKAESALKEAQVDEQSRMRRMDMLAYQIEEIEKAALRPGEEEELRAARQRLMHADRIGAALAAAVAALDGESRQLGAIALLAEAAQQVAAGKSFDARLEETAELLDTAQVHADEALRALSKLMSQIEHDPAALEAIEQRLAQIRSMQRKYGASEADVLAHLEAARQELETLERYEERLAELEKQCAAAREHLERIADTLHAQRVAAASRFAEEIAPILQRLNMPHATLRIVVEPRRDGSGQRQFGPHGSDSVVFLFSANKGESPKPLTKVASGGELSRTLLAIKAVLADVDDVDTLIFDEIDTGVSGSAALAIADQLRSLAARHQVLCVTHSPQLAAAAELQVLIAKAERTADTVTFARTLTRAERIAEIGRLLGSDVADTTAATHAEALLDRFERAASKG
ncbi:MAG: DNA repair protein RecN [Alicyclobacillus sp.]|nr:DNA repair protein RecN [Alicyclobacillus sp.]